jgi:hypothetical protein
MRQLKLTLCRVYVAVNLGSRHAGEFFAGMADGVMAFGLLGNSAQLLAAP